ncbi:cytochrome b/b6 domain-containing protein [Phenylobacterium sp.]|uniref:cytochrome b/b6 domain-containing protein n=1 Tax=Phenylobacterium sp. TaxID=1871053 RepID=UPI0035AF4492
MAREARPTTVVYKRHSGLVRATHWVNVLAISLLLMSGLQIFNAHPALYWGQKSTFADPWLYMGLAEIGDRPVGVTMVGDRAFETTGLFGYSGAEGRREPRGFPAWATVPSYRDLASGRRWHFFFAWLFVINGLVYLAAALLSRHRRDLLPTREQWRLRHIWRDVLDHARLRFPKGEAARTYNVLQKLTYLAMILGVLPLMLLTGLSMSPGFNAAAPWLIDLFGGRQSARSVHFICAGLIVLFVLVHVALVVLSGFWNNMRSMITGRYAIETEGPRP